MTEASAIICGFCSSWSNCESNLLCLVDPWWWCDCWCSCCCCCCCLGIEGCSLGFGCGFVMTTGGGGGGCCGGGGGSGGACTGWCCWIFVWLLLVLLWWPMATDGSTPHKLSKLLLLVFSFVLEPVEAVVVGVGWFKSSRLAEFDANLRNLSSDFLSTKTAEDELVDMVWCGVVVVCCCAKLIGMWDGGPLLRLRIWDIGRGLRSIVFDLGRWCCSTFNVFDIVISFKMEV